MLLALIENPAVFALEEEDATAVCTVDVQADNHCTVKYLT